MLFFCHSISVTHHSSLITLKYHVCLAPSLTFHHLIFFTVFVGLIPVTRCSFFFFFFINYPNSPNLVKKKKDPEQTEPVKEEEEEEEERIEQPTQEKKGKKKVKRWSEVAAEYCLWVSYVCLITILPLSYKLWKLKTAKMCFQFP